MERYACTFIPMMPYSSLSACAVSVRLPLRVLLPIFLRVSTSTYLVRGASMSEPETSDGRVYVVWKKRKKNSPVDRFCRIRVFQTRMIVRRKIAGPGFHY